MSLSKLNTTTINDLPADIICLVFEHLPLAEVLHSQALVCKAFYAAHRQHCRSSVKHLTLIGHYMVKMRKPRVVRTQDEIVRKQILFQYGRSTIGSASTSTINPSTAHLKLVAGLEETAYLAIGSKFKSVTHLELFQPALERHYKPITAMINAWGCEEGGNCPNQLTDLKIFFSKEIYNTNGTNLKRGNNSCCLAYLLAEALTPVKAPALRRLTIVPGNFDVAFTNRANHNKYSGPLLQKINLSQVVAINAPGFAVIDLPEERWGSGGGQSGFVGLQELTIKTGYILTDLIKWASSEVLFRLTSLKIDFVYNLSIFLETMQAKLVRINVRRLSLKVSSPLTDEVQQLIVPMTTTKGENNDHLEELCLTWERHRDSMIYASTEVVDTASLRVRFLSLNHLHLVKSTLLHREEEMAALSYLFPNLTYLRLDQNHTTTNLRNIKEEAGYRYNEECCQQCVQHTWDAFLLCNPNARTTGEYQNHLDVENGDAQRILSSTALDCKAALVRRAVAAWPKLAKISLQIDDFLLRSSYYYRNDQLNNMAINRSKYLYRCESVMLREPVTGVPVPEEALKWTVKEVLY